MDDWLDSLSEEHLTMINEIRTVDDLGECVFKVWYDRDDPDEKVKLMHLCDDIQSTNDDS